MGHRFLLNSLVLRLVVSLEVGFDFIWTGFYRVEDGLSFPDFLRQAIFAEEHVDIRLIDMRPRLFALCFVIKKNVQDPGMALREGFVIVLAVLAS